jgi:hypothetical protein
LKSWEIIFYEHRGTELAVLFFEALRIGLRKGQITAEDLHHIPVENPSVRGCAMRGLRRSGMFSKAGYTCGTTEQSHGHVMCEWRLDRHATARLLLQKFAADFGGSTRTGTGTIKGNGNGNGNGLRKFHKYKKTSYR